MTVRELIGHLKPYEGEGIRQVLAETGENITGICLPGENVVGIYPAGTYAVLITSETGDSLPVDGLITQLERLHQKDQEKKAVTDSMEEICGVEYACTAGPVLYLKYHT